MNKSFTKNRIVLFLLLLLTTAVDIKAQHHPLTVNIDSVYRVLDYTINHEEAYLKNKQDTLQKRLYDYHHATNAESL